jgi:hypothetical protein
MAFEFMLLRAFELDGARVTWPFRVHFDGHEIEQLDGVVCVDGLEVLVEAKDGGVQNMNPIAKMRSQLLRRPSRVVGMVASTGGFSEAARILASFTAPQTVLLWTKDDIDEAFGGTGFAQGLRRKYDAAVTHGVCDYSLKEAAL